MKFNIKQRLAWKVERMRSSIYKKKFNAHRKALIRRGIKCDYPSQVTIGDSFINYNVTFYVASPRESKAKIVIGNKVFIAPDVFITTVTHEIMGPEQRASSKTHFKPVTIDDGCWIGARAVILPGVHIGSGCVIGAGAVVAKDCDPNGVYVGVPARRIRDL